jgi:hypothetical protein
MALAPTLDFCLLVSVEYTLFSAGKTADFALLPLLVLKRKIFFTRSIEGREPPFLTLRTI